MWRIFAATDIADRKKAILYLNKIKSGIEEVDDQYILDQILSLLMQAKTSSRVFDRTTNQAHNQRGFEGFGRTPSFNQLSS